MILQKPKVIVLGFDGATFKVITPMIKEGKLPNMRRVMSEGVYGILQSTIPAHSAAAWTSFATGKNPGKHGVYSFRERSYSKDKFVSAKSRGSKAQWTILSEMGLRVGIVNIPITYPPEEVNGYMISGLDTPDEKSDYTYPKSLKEELNRELGRYIVEADTTDMYVIRNGKDREKFFLGIIAALETRRKAMRYLLKTYPVDLFAVAFMATDRVQHRCWHFSDPSHPHYTAEGNRLFGDLIPEVYERLDAVVGEVLDMVGDDTTILIMSDHGMGPRNDKTFYLNNWLIRNGYLNTVKVVHSSMIKRIVYFLKGALIAHGLKFVRTKLPAKGRHLIKRLMPAVHKGARLHESFASIDWNKTRVYADELMGVLRINLKGREENGIVEPGEEYDRLCTEIASKLAGIKDPETGEQVVSKVLKKEEIYKGPFTATEAPDLFIFWQNEQYSSQPSPPGRQDGNQPFLGKLKSEETSRALMYHTPGAHLPEGVLMIRGPHIEKNKEIKGAEIIDIAPTIFYLMGVPVPREMDGKVLLEAVTEEFRHSHPVAYTDLDTSSGTGAAPFSPEDVTKIQERLRNLGYIE